MLAAWLQSPETLLFFKAKSRSTQRCYRDPAVMERPALLRVEDGFEETESSDVRP